MRIVGNDPTLSRQLTATASGAISAAGKPLIVNTDGTVTSTILDSATESLGSEVVFKSDNTTGTAVTFDSNSNRIVVVYRNGSTGFGEAVVGTVSGTSVSFGTPVVFSPTGGAGINADQTDIAFDSNSNKVVIIYSDGAASDIGKAIVGTVDSSDNSISFGTAVTFENANVTSATTAITFDSYANKVVISYRDNGNSQYGTSVVGTVSGTSISFGTPVVFLSATNNYLASTFDSANNKVVITYNDGGNSNYGTAIVGTVSGTSISFGSAVVHESATTNYRDIVFDSTNNKVIISYQNQGSSPAYQLYGVVGTVSSTSISFGTAVSAGANTRAYDQGMAYDTKAQKAVVGFWDHYDSKGRYITLTVSGTNITWGTGALLNDSNLEDVAATFDSNSNRVVFGFRDHGNSNYGTAVVLQNGFTNENLTTENFIGTSAHAAADGAKVLVNTQGAIDENQSGLTAGQTFFVDKNGALQLTTNTAQSLGDEAEFTSSAANYVRVVYDSNSDRTVLIYRNGNDQTGEAIVGQVSGTSISYGSPVTFETGNTEFIGATFDSNSNRIVIVFRDGNNTNYGTAVVGNVNPSDNSISFGNPVVFHAGSTYYIDCSFDSNLNKVLVTYADGSNSDYGACVVGTVDTSSDPYISFGSEVVFASVNISGGAASTFDSANNKSVVVYSDNSDFHSKVGTISGTSISFGSEATISSGAHASVDVAYDTTSGKVLAVGRNGSNSNEGEASVGTVSGTSISFGTTVTYKSSAVAEYNQVVFDTSVDKAVVIYRDQGDSNKGKFILGTVSGTDISFAGETEFNAATEYMGLDFDSSSEKVVIGYKDSGDGDDGTVRVLQNGNDLSGSLSTDAVTAGTALSATKLLVKG